MGSELLQKLNKRRSQVDTHGETFQSTPSHKEKPDANSTGGYVTPQKTSPTARGSLSRSFKDSMNLRRQVVDNDGDCFENKPEASKVLESAGDSNGVFENNPELRAAQDNEEEANGCQLDELRSKFEGQAEAEDMTAKSSSDSAPHAPEKNEAPAEPDDPMEFMTTQDEFPVIVPESYKVLMLNGGASDGAGVLQRLKAEIKRIATEEWQAKAWTQMVEWSDENIKRAERTIIRRLNKDQGEQKELDVAAQQACPSKKGTTYLSPRAHAALLGAGHAADGEGVVARLEELIHQRSLELQKRNGEDGSDDKKYWNEAERSLIRISA